MENESAELSLSKEQLGKIVVKLGGFKEALRFLRGDLVVSDPNWHESCSVISLSVTSDGTNGPGWIRRLKEGGFSISESAESALLSDDFVPTKGVTTNIRILKGGMFIGSGYGYNSMCLCQKDARNTGNILQEAKTRKFYEPKAEIACLMREKLPDEEIKKMDLGYVAIMHEPFEIPNSRANMIGPGG
jgi:hypothetical protein